MGEKGLVITKVEAFENLLKAEGFEDAYIHRKFKEIFGVR